MRAIFGLGIVIIASAGGFIASRYWLQDSAKPAPQAEITASPQVKSLPDLTLADLEGKPRALSEWHGRPLLINFWATWCEPCRREIPLLRKLRAEHAAAGLEVLGIAIDFRDEVIPYVSQAGIEYPILIAEQNSLVPQAFGLGMGLPTTVFADRSGRIVATKVGELSATEAKKLLRPLLQAP